MVDKEIVDYIKKYQKEDFSESEIRDSLKSQDVDDKTIDEAFASLKKKDSEPSHPHHTHTKKSSGLPKKYFFLGSFFASLITGLVLLKNAGLGSGYLLTPFSSVMAVMRQEASINFPMLGFSLTLLASAFCILGYYALNREENDYIIYSATVLAVASIFILNGANTLSFLGALGAGISTGIFIYTFDDKKHQYRIVDFKEITVMTFRHAFVTFSVILAIGVYITLLGSSDFAEIEVSSFVSSAGLSMEGSNNLQTQIMEKQRTAQNELLDSITQAVDASVQADPDIANSCKLRVSEKIGQINTAARSTLDEQLEEEFDEALPEGSRDQLAKLQKMIDALKKNYPLLTAMTVFMLIELLRKGVAFLLMAECHVLNLIRKKEGL